MSNRSNNNRGASGGRTFHKRESTRKTPEPGTESFGEEHEGSEEQYLAGKNPVLEALKAGRPLNKIWLSSQAQRHLVGPILEEAKTRGVVVQHVDKRKLDQLVPGVTHQGVVAQAAPTEYVEVDELLARAAERGEMPLLVLLDEVEDPHNLGSVLRTVDCTGAHGVVVPKRRSASLTAVVAKTSAGAVEYVPVARVANLVQTIEKLKEAGVWIAGADAAAESDVFRSNLTGPLAVVIGSEGRGLSRLVREKCDFLISLPMFGRINSLNASVAAGVILYEAVRQRREQSLRAAASITDGDGHAPA
ncbi:23S rRNA (guanosine(2251)-2'-O)-methyltransferase RlmB [Cohnella pontilimi]|uniref:23S rRNA (Guanosine(2251)-2'-O)-methyltransferase RlmB n=1 Tax=Cohnella pontilimi TaxID=2564100 RepID=A0A4U0F2Y8_9BACL|nr:23S rRNA (guanosine(2251)-2'-O)-methyltransferase RlmB [Cohnella pontilimi]TJY38886.1 23S rRNA (guanosine(2251)-2'-O)-methyltransferase RlmB [Cohnella pontilimi]